MILVVDDNKQIHEQLEDLLMLYDKDIISAYCVDDFYKKLNNLEEYEAIIMDYNLEDYKNGIDLLKELQEKYKTEFERLKIYFFSGNVEHISQNEKDFLGKNNILSFNKTQTDELVETISE